MKELNLIRSDLVRTGFVFLTELGVLGVARAKEMGPPRAGLLRGKPWRVEEEGV